MIYFIMSKRAVSTKRLFGFFQNKQCKFVCVGLLRTIVIYGYSIELDTPQVQNFIMFYKQSK